MYKCAACRFFLLYDDSEPVRKCCIRNTGNLKRGVLDISNWPLPAVRDLKVPKYEILISWILMIFFIKKSLQVGDFRDEIKILHFYRWVRYGPFCFCYHMRCLRQQISTAYAAYASNELPHAQHTLAIGYRMRSIRQQSTEYLTICYRMHSICLQIATVCEAYASNLLP